MKVSVGLIGCGGISKFHVRYLQETGTRVAMVSDLRLAAAEACAAPFGARAVSDWKQVVGDPEVNTVICCAPSALHAPIAEAALLAGKHVISEKTLALQADDSLRIGRLAVSRDLRLYTNYMKRFFPAVQRARQLVPEIGRILSINVRVHQFAGVDLHSGGPTHAFFTPDAEGHSPIWRMSGGGILVCGGSHMLDLLVHLAGTPSTAYGKRWLNPGYDADYMFHGLLGYDSGAVAHVDCLWHNHSGVGFEGRGWDESIEIFGTRGRIRLEMPVWDQPERAAARLIHYSEATRATAVIAHESVNPFVEAGKHYLEQIAAGTQGGMMDAFAGHRVDALIGALWRSSETGREVDLAHLGALQGRVQQAG